MFFDVKPAYPFLQSSKDKDNIYTFSLLEFRCLSRSFRCAKLLLHNSHSIFPAREDDEIPSTEFPLIFCLLFCWGHQGRIGTYNFMVPGLS